MDLGIARGEKTKKRVNNVDSFYKFCSYITGTMKNEGKISCCKYQIYTAVGTGSVIRAGRHGGKGEEEAF